MNNLQTVREMYAAFGAGDLPTILSKLADDVEWDADAKSSVPLIQPRHGRGGAGEFFASMAAVDFTKFAPTEFLANDNIVIALIDVEFTVKATGKKVSQLDEVHIWRFNSDGLVTNFRHRVDSHAQHLAFEA